MGSFLHFSPPKRCVRLSSPPYELHAPPISFFSILSPEQYWVTPDIFTKAWVFSFSWHFARFVPKHMAFRSRRRLWLEQSFVVIQEVTVLRSNRTLRFHEDWNLTWKLSLRHAVIMTAVGAEFHKTSSCIPFQPATQSTMASSPHSGGRFHFKTTFKYVCNRGRLRVTAFFLNDCCFATQQVKLAYTR